MHQHVQKSLCFFKQNLSLMRYLTVYSSNVSTQVLVSAASVCVRHFGLSSVKHALIMVYVFILPKNFIRIEY